MKFPSYDQSLRIMFPSGEIAASYAAGILPLASCMAISYYRGMAIVSLKAQFPSLKGAMMAVGASEEEITPLIAQLKEKEVNIACFNSPSSLTISGDEVALDELQKMVESKSMFNRKLKVDVAYHSQHMKLIAEEYAETLDSIDQPVKTEVLFYSSVFGKLLEGSALQPSYFVDNLTNAVRFSEALASMCKSDDGHKTGIDMIIEIGPAAALAGPVKQVLKAGGKAIAAIPYASALVRNRDAVDSVMDLAATLYLKGATLNMGAVNFPRLKKNPTLLVDMPRYPWNHQTKYWHASRLIQKHRNRATPRSDIIGTVATYSNDLEPTWRNIIRIDDLPWLRHHKIQDLTLFPMSGFLSMAIEAASQRAATRGSQFEKFILRDVVITVPLMITDEDVEMTIQLRPLQDIPSSSSETWDEFRIHSYDDGKGWTEHCKGFVGIQGHDSNDFDRAKIIEDSRNLLQSRISEINSQATTQVDKSSIYNSLADLGVVYGPTFQGMNDCRAGTTCSAANIITEDTSQEMPEGFQTDTVIHTAFLEQLIEMYWPILGAGHKSLDTVYLPSSIEHMTVSRNVTELTCRPGDRLRGFCHNFAPPLRPKPAQISLFATASGSDELIIKIDNLTISPILERDAAADEETPRELCFKLQWEPVFENSQLSDGVTMEHPHSIVNGAGFNGLSSNCDLEIVKARVVIIHSESHLQVNLATKLGDVLEQTTGQRPDIGTLGNVQAEGKLCIFISELDQPMLSSLTPTQFTELQKLLAKVQGILWIVRGAYAESKNPDANMVTGLSRSIRSETLLKFATLDLDPKSEMPDELVVQAVLKVLASTFGSNADPECKLEFMERNGSLFTPRIVNDEEMNTFVHKQIRTSVLEPTPFCRDGRALKMAIGTVSNIVETRPQAK